MKWILVCLLLPAALRAQEAPETTIRNLMLDAEKAWNAGNIDRFMEDYWHSDSLMFIGKANVTYGFDSTVARYKTSYPDKATMGILHFNIMTVKQLSPEYCWVLGQWSLNRTKDKPGGHFTLLFKYINGRWTIIADHTS